MHHKIEQWLAAGTALVWIVNPHVFANAAVKHVDAGSYQIGVLPPSNANLVTARINALDR